MPSFFSASVCGRLVGIVGWTMSIIAPAGGSAAITGVARRAAAAAANRTRNCICAFLFNEAALGRVRTSIAPPGEGVGIGLVEPDAAVGRIQRCHGAQLGRGRGGVE